MIKLKEYQNLAVNDKETGMLSKAESILRMKREDNGIDSIPLILLKSITGSGKTIIAAEFIEELLNSPDRNPDREMAIIWLSKGNARLHMQSYNKIRSVIDDADIHVYGLEDSSNFNADLFEDKDVYVINWEKLNNLKSNKLASNIFLDTEHPNLTRAISNTRKHTDMDFVFIVDEFHTNYNTKSYRKIVEMFNPCMIVGMTATPLHEQIEQTALTNGRYIKIRVSDVQKEEMVKKGILFNTSKNITVPSDYATREEYFLRLAISERDKLERLYKSEGSNIIPLLLIQFDDDRSGDGKNEEIVTVKDKLDELYNNNENNTYAIWLSNAKNGEKLRSDDSVIHNLDHNDVRILLFKQAVAMGWDCPRAQILLRLRKVSEKKDPSFDLQTIGRIFRMPEQHYYFEEELNYGYVYVPRDSYVLEKTVKDGFNDGDGGENILKTERHSALRTATPFEVPTNVLPVAKPAQNMPSSVQSDTSNTKPDIANKRASDSNSESTTSNTQPIQTNVQTNSGETVTHSINENITNLEPESVNIATSVSKSVGITEIERLNLAFKGQNETIESSKPTEDELYEELIFLIKSIDNTALKGLEHKEELGTGEDYESRELLIDDAYANGATKLKDMHETTHIAISNKMREIEVNKELKDLLRSKYTGNVRDAFVEDMKGFFYKQTDKSKSKEERTDDQNVLFLLNESVVKDVEYKLDNFNHMNVQRRQGKNSDLKLPNDIFTKDSTEPSEKNLYGYISKSLSNPEKIFVKKLEESDNVKYWIKCQDKGPQALCIIYRSAANIRGKSVYLEQPTYPDFLVSFIDGSIGIFEIKDINDTDHQNENNDKERAILNRINKLNALKNGFRYTGGLIYVNTKTECLMDQVGNSLDVL